VTQECQPSHPAEAGILHLTPDFPESGGATAADVANDGGDAGAILRVGGRPARRDDGVELVGSPTSQNHPGFGELRGFGYTPVPVGYGIGRGRKGVVLNLPNLITLGRILLVPVVVWAIASHEMQAAFVLFLLAGVSDAVDGFLAKRFHMTSELGAHLDPLADKVLIVSIYIALGITEAIPRWIVILVVSRDILIVGGIMLAVFLGKPMKVKPVLVSKLNTVAQIVFACLVLAALAFGFTAQLAEQVIMGTVAVLTLASIGFYVREWVVHMSAAELDG
jgi:cardiolipin synthase (CMP-forming)